MNKIASPTEFRAELQTLMTQASQPGVSRAAVASTLRDLARRVAAVTWKKTTSTSDGYRKFEATDGNVELHADGFEKGPRKGDWTWSCSVIEGPYKEKKGKASSESEAKRRCEAAAKKL